MRSVRPLYIFDLDGKSTEISEVLKTLSVWTVYDRPRDHPDHFVARRWVTGGVGPEPMPTADVLMAPSLAEVRALLFATDPTLVRFDRAPLDDECIVEMWL